MPHVNGDSVEPKAQAPEATLPADAEGNIIEVPSTRSAVSDVQMQSLSLNPSMKDRRASRNSFGVSLPIPRSSRPSRSRLSSVTTARDHVRDIVASGVQDRHEEKVKAVKNMAFCFDIDGVLAHGNIGLQQAKDTLRILNGDNELGKSEIKTRL